MLTDVNIKNKKQKRLVKQTGFVRWRFALLLIFIFLALAILLGQLAWLQLINPDRLIQEGNSRIVRSQEIPVTRGIISDRNGRPLAVSVPAYSICVNTQKVDLSQVKEDKRWQGLAEALNLSLAKLDKTIKDNYNKDFFYLKRQVTPEIADYIRTLKLPGICWEQGTRRFYPSGEATAQLVGVTDIDAKGIEGIERSFNTLLTGQPGSRTVHINRDGLIIEVLSSIDRQTPHNLTLSIDERIQSIVYDELSEAVVLNRAESGSAVVIDVLTGEILAIVNSPSYNPNNRYNIPPTLTRNRAITDMFEPGSTVKPLVIMTGLKLGVIKENTMINTQGPLVLNYKAIRDVAPRDELSIAGIIQKSSNIGVSKIALQIPIQQLVETYRQFGFGQETNLGLVGEAKGIFPHNKARWADIERATFSYGYGLMVTPLQLARAYAAIGSGGIAKPLSITKIDPPVYGERIMPEEIVRKVINMMEMVTAPGEGGAKAAVKGYRVAVKTGTAKKVGSSGGYVNKYIAYTAGIAPVSNPRYALVIVIDNPSAGKFYGGAVSAPVFSSVMGNILRIMNIKPDAVDVNTDLFVTQESE